MPEQEGAERAFHARAEGPILLNKPAHMTLLAPAFRENTHCISARNAKASGRNSRSRRQPRRRVRTRSRQSQPWRTPAPKCTRASTRGHLPKPPPPPQKGAPDRNPDRKGRRLPTQRQICCCRLASAAKRDPQLYAKSAGCHTVAEAAQGAIVRNNPTFICHQIN